MQPAGDDDRATTSELVGNYRIIGKLGEGGMGVVYLVEHTILGRRAALKMLRADLSSREDLAVLFFQEARAATAVRHPGIVDVYDFGFGRRGTPYIVMEYLDGETLSSRLRAGVLDEARAVATCRQLVRTLAAAHAAGIVHRDLKPENVFLVPDPDHPGGERTKLLDFGIAKMHADDVFGGSTTTRGTVMGTPAYMAPEQCKGTGEVDHRADLYAVGCILYEMLCGRPPFVSAGGGELMAQHIFGRVPAPSSFRAITPALERTILRMLAKDPDDRFASADDLIAALDSATG